MRCRGALIACGIVLGHPFDRDLAARAGSSAIPWITYTASFCATSCRLEDIRDLEKIEALMDEGWICRSCGVPQGEAAYPRSVPPSSRHAPILNFFVIFAN